MMKKYTGLSVLFWDCGGLAPPFGGCGATFRGLVVRGEHGRAVGLSCTFSGAPVRTPRGGAPGQKTPGEKQICLLGLRSKAKLVSLSEGGGPR